MKLFFLLSFCFLVSTAHAQNTASDFNKDQCDFKTDGLPKSLGLKIKFTVPCAWKAADGERPHVIKKFSYSFPEGGTLIATITISEMQKVPSASELDDVLSDKGLKDIAESLGTYISSRSVQIDGMTVGEVVFNTERESTIGSIYMTGIQYFFFYKDKMVVMLLSSGSTNQARTDELFEEYKTLFRGIAGNTVFVSKWE